jgi:hypothetical protein
MNASMARRIRNAEAVLISAIDRCRCGRREWSRRYETAQHWRIPIHLAFAFNSEPAPPASTGCERPK